MFFLHELERVITLPPSRFGPHVEECLRNKLLEDVEGTCTGQYYIVCVMDTYDISEGRVLPSSGVAEYTIHYRAVVWRPFKGETVGFSFSTRLLILREKTIGFFLLRYISLSFDITGRRHRYVCQRSWCIRRSRSAVSLRFESCMCFCCHLFHSTFGTHSHIREQGS